jgi:hypothetical protein
MPWVRVEELGKIADHERHGEFDLCCHSETEKWAAIQRSSQNPLVFFMQGRPATSLAIQRCREALWRLTHAEFAQTSLDEKIKAEREAQRQRLDQEHDARCALLAEDKSLMGDLRHMLR